MPDPFLPDKKTLNPKDPNPCAGCSNCCEYVSLEIDRPTVLKDFDNILWYLLHKDIWVYIDEHNDWYLQFNTPCEKLEQRRCGYYATRPQMCRNYAPSDCVRYGEGEAEKYLFKNEDDLFHYMAKRRPAIFKKMQKSLGLPAQIHP